VDPLELARGGEVLLRRLGDLNSANSDLRRQLELQVKEVSTLQDVGMSQQQLLRDFERQAEQARQAQEATTESKVRAQIGEREAQLQRELEETTEQARLDKEDFMARLHRMAGEFRHVEGERDEARERIRELEERLGINSNAPGTQAERTKGLDMELSLVRARLERETEAKKAAERASAESRAQQQDLKLQLEKEMLQVKHLQKALAEQSELASFRQEICNDLQVRIKDQKREADKRLLREKGKHEVVSRLEGILPRHFLIDALA
jgi:chromosome segregation ATPase